MEPSQLLCDHYGRYGLETTSQSLFRPLLCLTGEPDLRTRTMTKVQLNLLDAVALLSDQNELGLVQGQVGTVVELLDDDFALVEFCDRDGATFSMPTLPISSLLRLSYEQVAA